MIELLKMLLPGNEYKALYEEQKIRNAFLLARWQEHMNRDVESEAIQALKKQNELLAQRCVDYDRLIEEWKRVRATLKDLYPRAVEDAESTNMRMADLIVWVLRGKPGSEVKR
jgi:hypothetical protein